jgi:phosphoglycerol transferase MdoB-like AlkP superfamily enzyme
MHPIGRAELWHAEATLFVAFILQLTLSKQLQIGSKYFVSGLLLLLIFGVLFTAPRRHTSKGSYHVTISTLLIGLVSLANAAELALLGTGSLTAPALAVAAKETRSIFNSLKTR